MANSGIKYRSLFFVTFLTFVGLRYLPKFIPPGKFNESFMDSVYGWGGYTFISNSLFFLLILFGIIAFFLHFPWWVSRDNLYAEKIVRKVIFISMSSTILLLAIRLGFVFIKSANHYGYYVTRCIFVCFLLWISTVWVRSSDVHEDRDQVERRPINIGHNNLIVRSSDSDFPTVLMRNKNNNDEEFDSAISHD